jgi:signal transduction histidine kinase
MLLTWLTDYGPSNLEAVIFLVFSGVLVAAGYWRRRRRWQTDARRLALALAQAQQRAAQLQDELAEARRQHELAAAQHQRELKATETRHDPAQIKAQQDHLQRVIAHEFVKGLHFILSQCEETAAALDSDQPELRNRQNQACAKAHEMIQHARNIVELPDLERNAAQREMVNLRGLLEGILKELFPYAEARGIHLRTHYGSLGPISVSRPLVTQMYRNVIHNAIHYSLDGGVVDIALRQDGGDAPQAVVEVRDRGRGIEAKDHERIFELNTRGDGLAEPGSGLGLFHARKIARLHGGDVELVESKPNEGSTFRMTLPCN